MQLLQVILAMQRCDGDPRNCWDGSDEDVKMCKGDTPVFVLVVLAALTFYVLAGMAAFAYVKFKVCISTGSVYTRRATKGSCIKFESSVHSVS